MDPSGSMSHSPHEEKRAPGPYKQSETSPRKCKVSLVAPWQETYLVQTHFRKTEKTTNHPHQNLLVTGTKIKALHKKQTYETLNKNK
jgi:hypothetical protein